MSKAGTSIRTCGGAASGVRYFSEAESWARSNGCAEMASDTLAENEAGLAAHQACGYVETGTLIHLKKRL